MLKPMLCALISITLIVNQLAWATFVRAAEASELTYEVAMQRLDRVMAANEKLRSLIDRTTFDLDALLEKLDHDDEQIIAFVRDEVAFEQYPGLLRGPAGTLMSRAGNALDQSVLVAKLLNDAGYDAQVVAGTLGDDQVDTLLRQIAQVSRQSDMSNYERAREAILEMANSLDLAREEMAEVESLLQVMINPASEETDFLKETSELLMAALEQAGVTLSNEDYLKSIWKEAAEYFWVRYREGPSKPWRPVHPAFASADTESLLQLTERTVYADTIPEQLQHRVGLSILIEQQLGDATKTHILVPTWEVPAANLHAVQIEFANVPSGINSVDILLEQEDWLQDPVFVPTINGQLPNDGLAFDLNGYTFPLAESATAEGGYFRTLNQAAESALSALMGKDKGEDVVKLTRQWLDYSIVSPSGEIRSERRLLFDREEWHAFNSLLSQQHPPSSLNAYAAGLLGSVLFIVNTGRIPVEYQLDRLTAHTLALRPAFEALIERTLGNQPETDWPTMAQTSPSSLFDIFSAFDLPDEGGGSNVYRSAPTIVAHEQRLRWSEQHSEPSLWSSVDIVHAPRRAFEFTDSKFSAAPKKVLERGVWESFAEGIHSYSVPESVRYTAFEDLQELQKSSSPYRVLGTSRGAAERTHSGGTGVVDDPRDKRIAIVPRWPTAGKSAWWRVDPETGTTHAIGPDGRGTAQTEYYGKLALGYVLSVAACVVTMVAMNAILQILISAKTPLLTPKEVGICLAISAFPAAQLARGYFTAVQVNLPVHVVGGVDLAVRTVSPPLVWGYGVVVGYLNFKLMPDSF